MKTKCFLVLVIFISFFDSVSVLGQNNEQEKIKTTFGGYINWTGIYDTRQTVSLREGQFLLYPTDILKDKNGIDINDKANFNFLSVQSRLTPKLLDLMLWERKQQVLLKESFLELQMAT